jgi:phosphopantothenoylcysteine synthetase/decarboxylase
LARGSAQCQQDQEAGRRNARARPHREPRYPCISSLVIGFAAETEHIIEHAKAKLARKGCDWIVANDVSADTGIMGGDRNTVHLVTLQGVESWPPQSKKQVAQALVARIADTLAGAAK